MRMLVESLKRLYVAGKVSEVKVIELYNNGVITVEEKIYILN